MTQLLTWHESLRFILEVIAAVGFFVYLALLARNARRALTTARVRLARVFQPDADMSEDARAALDGGRLSAFRTFNSLALAGVALFRTSKFVRRGGEMELVFLPLFLPWLITSIVFEIFPRTLTIRRCEILYIAAASGFACERLMGAQLSPVFEVALIVLRVTVSMVVCKPRLVLGVNALITAGNLANNRMFHPHPMYGTLQSARRSETFILLAATTLSYSSHFFAVRSASLQSELQTALKAQGPLRSLLARWCDATVELGSDLRISQHSVNLSALLFRPCCRLQGTLFEDLLHRADRPRFAQVVASCTAIEGPARHASPAQVIQVALLDGNGNAVPVQLVHTCIQDDKADYRHFIGIREEDTEFHAAPPPPVADLALTRQSWEQALRTVGAPDVEARVIGAVSDDGSQQLGATAGGPRSLPSTVGSSGGSSGSNCTWHNIGDVHVSVDVSSSGLEMIDASETFIELGGSETIGSSFSTWVEDGGRLRRWLEESANGLVNKEERLPEYFGSLRFKTPIATCRAAGVAIDVDDFYFHAAVCQDLEDSIRVRVVLSGVQAASHGALRARSNRHGSRTRMSL